MIKWADHPEMIQFMKEFIPGHTEHEIRDAFLKEFNILMSRSQIKNFKARFRIRSGTNGGQFQKGNEVWNKGKKMSAESYQKIKKTMFQEGHIPANHKDVGSERVNVDGYIEIKIAEPNKWMLKQRYVYEQHYKVKLKPDDVIIFLDGNKLNVDIDNLFRFTRAALVRMNQDKLYCGHPEITKAAAQMAMLKSELCKRRKSNGRTV